MSSVNSLVARPTERLQLLGPFIAEVPISVGVVDVEPTTVATCLAAIAGTADDFQTHASPAIRREHGLVLGAVMVNHVSRSTACSRLALNPLRIVDQV